MSREYRYQSEGKILDHTLRVASIKTFMEIEKDGGTVCSPREERKLEKIEEVQNYWLGGFIIIGLGILALHVLLRIDVIPSGVQKAYFLKLSLSAFIISLILIIGKFSEKIVMSKSDSKSFKYNFIRVMRLIMIILIALVVISFFFKTWYAGAVSLGLISLILGFALQAPISSIIGWIYIILRTPYRVGDRIEIGDFTGDVVEIGYLDTTLWEFGGSYLSGDLPSGRLIRFPNTLIFQSAVFNYSWPKFPYIWNEIGFQVGYDSDLPFVKNTLREVALAELDPSMADHISELKEIIKDTPVDELQINEYPFVHSRISVNTWVELVVTYLVHPKKASATRTRIIDQALYTLNAHQQKVRFPKGDAR